MAGLDLNRASLSSVEHVNSHQSAFVVKKNLEIVSFDITSGDILMSASTLLHQFHWHQHSQGIPALTIALFFPFQLHEQREKQHWQRPEHRPGEW